MLRLKTARNIDVCKIEDNYEEGEIGKPRYYQILLEGDYEDINDLFDDLSNYNFERKNSYFEDGILHCTCFTDGNDNIPTKDELELWKKGEFKLYTQYIQFEIMVVDEHLMTDKEFNIMK